MRWEQISQKWLQTEVRFQQDRRGHMTLNDQGHHPDMFGAYYLENDWR